MAPTSQTTDPLNRPCPVCHGMQAGPYLMKDNFQLLRCPDCSMIFTNPVAADLASGEFYDQAGTEYLSPEKLESDYAEVRFERELRLFRNYCSSGAVLDVGCSSGAFLYQLNKRYPGDYQILGTDASGPPLDHAAKMGVPVIKDDFLTHTFEQSFDAITFWAVMEHLFEPEKFLKKAASILKPGGVCFILVPNMHSLAASLLGAKYRYVYSEHLNYFTAATLRKFVKPQIKVLALKSTHFNPMVIWQDSRRPPQEVSRTERYELLKRTTAYKKSLWLKPVKVGYRMMEMILGTVWMADNLCIISQKAKNMDQTLETIRKKYNLPALAAVVVKDGQICDRAAVGVRKWGDPTPVTTNDIFHIGSCTKSMTATLAGMLIDDGKLRWDTTIAEVFPELKSVMNKQYEAVTVEELLTHRGGFPTAPPQMAWKQAWAQQGTPVEQRYEFIKAVLAQPPEAAPGTKTIYSNQGYTIIGAMLERIAGIPWERLITERLFKPLQMDTAGFGPPGTIGGIDEPWGHVRKPGMIVPVQGDNPPVAAPAGRVHCSLDDMARYTIFQMQGPRQKLLKPETLERLHTPPAGGDYACGWHVYQRGWAGGNALTHNGSNTMWYFVMWLAPEKNFSVIVATNIYGPDAQKACDDAASAMTRKWLAE